MEIGVAQADGGPAEVAVERVHGPACGCAVHGPGPSEGMAQVEVGARKRGPCGASLSPRVVPHGSSCGPRADRSGISLLISHGPSWIRCILEVILMVQDGFSWIDV